MKTQTYINQAATQSLNASERKLEKLAEIINQEPAALSTANIATLTGYYNLDILERVLRQVMPECLDITISFISKRWQIDVYNKMEYVVRYDAKRCCYMPYTEDLPAKLEEMKQRILRRRELEQGCLLDLQALVAMHDGNSTQTQSEPADVENSTSSPQFQDDNKVITDPPCHAGEEEAENEEEPEYHMADLPYDVPSLFIFKDDVTYSIFVRCMYKVKEWVDCHRKQDWNVVRFVLVLRSLLARKQATLKRFSKFLQHIFPGIGDQENNMKHRQDADDDDNYERYDDPQKCKWQKCKQLKEDGSEVEDYFKPVIAHINKKKEEDAA